MAAKGLEAKTVGLKVKTTKFQVRTLDHTGQSYVCTADDLFAAASALLQKEIRAASTCAPGGALRLRLMGIKASAFRGQAGVPPLPGQATLDGFLARQQATAQDTDKLRGGAAATATEGAEKGRDRPSAVAMQLGVEGTGTGRGARESAEDLRDAGRDTPGQRGRMSRLDVDAVSNSATQLHPGETEFGAPLGSGPLSPSISGSSRREQGSEGKQGLWEESWTGGGSFKVEGGGEAPPAAAPTASGVTCPVCGEHLGSVSNAALNRHVDACLGVCTSHDRDGRERLGLAATLAGGESFGSRREKPFPQRKRAKVAAVGIEKFLTPKERT